MVWACEIVVRVRDGVCRAGYAHEIPAKSGWVTVRSFGRWYKSQMEYRPHARAWAKAHTLADELNDDDSFWS